MWFLKFGSLFAHPVREGIRKMSQSAIESFAAVDNAVQLAPAEIFASIELRADVSRILHALAIPEYMEAWLHPPDAERIECHADGRSFDRFRLVSIAGGLRRESIRGACLLSKPNKITYVLERDGGAGPGRSLVEIRLWSHADGCTLRLAQSGLVTGEEREWHEKMWQQSFRKLRGLLEGTALRPSDHTSRQPS